LADTESASDQVQHQTELALGQAQPPDRRLASDHIPGLTSDRDMVQSTRAITDGHVLGDLGPRLLSRADTMTEDHTSCSNKLDGSQGVEPGSSAPLVAEQGRVTTRSRHGISKPKVYTDGIIRYSFLASVGEPATVQEALNDLRWREAMNMEFEALHANNTWSCSTKEGHQHNRL
jgi:hypothetical protein